MSNAEPMPLWKSFACSAVAACTAETLTIPIDTAKVRLQLQTSVAGQTPKYSGMMGTMMTVAKEEGPAALWKGLGPGLHRQCLFGGLRIGLYEPVKNFYAGDVPASEVPTYLKVAAGLTTGAVAISIASPTDLVKVRMQAEGKLPEGTPKKYPSAMKAYGIIAKEEGIAGLWTGLGPNVARNAIINAVELASYDEVKSALLKAGMEDGAPCHIMSGLGAGFFACIFGSPVDVVKSRVMGDSAGVYKGVVDCFVKTFKNDGPMAFYKGFVPNFGRLGSWNVAMFFTLEQVKKAVQSMDK